MAFENFFKKFDLYGIRINLNLNGQEKFHSTGGALVSLILYLSFFAFSGYKLILLVTFGDTKLVHLSQELNGSVKVSQILFGIDQDVKFGTWSTTLTPSLPTQQPPQV